MSKYSASAAYAAIKNELKEERDYAKRQLDDLVCNILQGQIEGFPLSIGKNAAMLQTCVAALNLLEDLPIADFVSKVYDRVCNLTAYAENIDQISTIRAWGKVGQIVNRYPVTEGT